MKIKSLSIKSFRGATKPLKIEFDPAKNITMIFGENGNGKTTISDALVCLCRDGEYGSLQDKSSIDKSFLCSIGAQPGDAQIDLETELGKFVARLNAKPLGSFSKSPMDGFPNLRYLRRKQIIDLLEDQPSKRYEKVQEYIDVTNVMTSEDALRKLIKSTKVEQASETKSLTDSTGTLERIWENEKRPMDSWEAWVQEESQKDISQEQQKHRQLSNAFQQWQFVSNKNSTVRQQKQDLEGSEKQVADLEARLSKIEEDGKTGNPKLLLVLEAAQTFINNESLVTSCPVCKNSVVKEQLIASLKSEIDSMKSLQSVTRELENAKQARGRCVAIIASGQAELKTLSTSYCSVMLPLFVKKGSSEEQLILDLQTHTNSDTAYDFLQSHFISCEDFMKKVEARIAQTLKTIQLVSDIRESYKTILRVRENALHLQQVLDAAERALEIVEAERKKFIEDSLDAVSADIAIMYKKLHLGEELGDIKLFLNPNRKNSLEMTGSFYGQKEISMQSLYSESHLDTLGICIFLALAKKYKAGDTILLLDDVMMSIDDKHLDRIIGLLHDEAANFEHIIITTHYRPWRDRYRTHRGAGGKVHFIELRNWTKEAGITVQNGRVQMHELELALNDKFYFDRQVIASKSGILLENLLDYLTDIYEYHLPKRKTLKYTLGELMDTLQAKYLKNIKAIHTTVTQNGGKEESVETEYLLQPVVDDLKKLMFIRNQVGAHFNLDEDASDDDVMLFGKKTLEMGQILVCSQTGQLPLTKSGDHWKSKQGTIKLFPSEKN